MPGIYYYQILSTKFTNNYASSTNGGALYLSNVKSMLISKTTFYLNYAEKKGAAIYTDCERVTYNCSLTLLSVNTFKNNTAHESGGGIYWADVEPIYKDYKDLVFTGNYALIYANDIASFPAKLVYLNRT